jgi:hypothetical protein
VTESPSPERLASKVAIKIALLQFATDHPEIAGLFDRAGLSPIAGYFPLRVYPMGAIPGSLAAAAMPFFPAVRVEKMVDRAYSKVAPAAFADIARECLTRAAEERFGAMEGLSELTELLETAAAGADLAGRPIAASWSSVAWEGEAARLFGAATVLREHRGEGHYMAVRVSGLTGPEMHVLVQAGTGRAPDDISHGFRPDAIEAAGKALRSRGLLEGWAPTSAAEHLMADIEVATGRLDLPPWRHLGDDGVARVVELGANLPKP